MKETTILCSGFGLGFYIPGLLIRTSLEKMGVKVSIDVFEHYMEKSKKEKITKSKRAYQNNFKVANMATRYPVDMEKCFEVEQIEKLLADWKSEGRRNFISLSGHWIYILEAYQKKIFPEQIHVDLLYVDSGLAPSWKSLKKYRPNYNTGFQDRWLYDFDKKRINYAINVDVEIIPYKKRDRKLVVHGGGWGLGTYKATVEELCDRWDLEVVAYQEFDNEKQQEGISYYMNDPSWKAWEADENGHYIFPPFRKLSDDSVPYQHTEKNHWLLDITRECKAIVSKPGAGTLIDSFATSTPLIMLDPFGEHEKKNTAVWKALGFGIPYDEWKAQDFADEILDKMQEKLKNAKENNTDYAEYYYGLVLDGGCSEES